MNQLERDLREALRRREPPQGLEERILARAQRSEVRSPSWTWLAVAAMLVLMVGGFGIVQEQRRRAEGERAKEQLMVAFRITGSKLRDVRERIVAIPQRVIQRSQE